MNIIDAAKALNEGKKVRIKHWIGNDKYLFQDGRKLLAYVTYDAEFYAVTTDDILADDWEIYEEQSPMKKEWREWIVGKYQSDAFLGIWEAAWNAAEKHFTQQLQPR